MDTDFIMGGGSSSGNLNSPQKRDGKMGKTKVSSRAKNASSKDVSSSGESVLKETPPPLPPKPERLKNWKPPKKKATEGNKNASAIEKKLSKGHFEKKMRRGRGERESLVQGEPRLDVRKKALSEGKELGAIDRDHFVKVEGTDYAINIRSAAKRLGLTRAELKLIVTNEGAEENLRRIAENRAKALKKYETLFADYKLDFYGDYRGEGKKIGLRPEVILKAITKGLELPDQKFFFEVEQKGKTFKFDASKDFSELYINKKLGEGSFGVVYKRFEIVGKTAKALKETKGVSEAAVGGFEESKENYAVSLSELQKEHEIVSDLIKAMGNQKVDGLPAKGLAEVTVFDHNSESVGKVKKGILITELALGDLQSKALQKKFRKLKVHERLARMQQLLDGLEFAHRQGYAHGDIKPENILGKIDSEGVLEKLWLHDWSGARKDGFPQPNTFIYLPFDAAVSLLSAKIGQDRKEIGQKADVFALSLTIIEGLIGEKMVDISRKNSGVRSFYTRGGYARPVKENSRVEGVIKKKLAKNGIPENVANVLLTGLRPQNERPSIQTLRESYIQAVI